MCVLNPREKGTDDYNKQKANVSTDHLNWIWNIKQRIICRENISRKKTRQYKFLFQGNRILFFILDDRDNPSSNSTQQSSKPYDDWRIFEWCRWKVRIDRWVVLVIPELVANVTFFQLLLTSWCMRRIFRLSWGVAYTT